MPPKEEAVPEPNVDLAPNGLESGGGNPNKKSEVGAGALKMSIVDVS